MLDSICLLYMLQQELISSLAGKLEVLREARHSVQEDMEDNETNKRFPLEIASYYHYE